MKSFSMSCELVPKPTRGLVRPAVTQRRCDMAKIRKQNEEAKTTKAPDLETADLTTAELDAVNGGTRITEKYNESARKVIDKLRG